MGDKRQRVEDTVLNPISPPPPGFGSLQRQRVGRCPRKTPCATGFFASAGGCGRARSGAQGGGGAWLARHIVASVSPTCLPGVAMGAGRPCTANRLHKEPALWLERFVHSDHGGLKSAPLLEKSAMKASQQAQKEKKNHGVSPPPSHPSTLPFYSC